MLVATKGDLFFFFSGFARLWPVVIWTPASQLLERWNVSCLHYP